MSSQATGYKLLAARVLVVVIFLMGGVNKIMNFSGTVGYIDSKGIVPFVTVAAGLAILLELVGGLSVLLGYKTELGSWILVAYLVPVTLIMHNFWAVDGEMIAFLKNLAIIGGLIALSIAGPGEYALDSTGGDDEQAEPVV